MHVLIGLIVGACAGYILWQRDGVVVCAVLGAAIGAWMGQRARKVHLALPLHVAESATPPGVDERIAKLELRVTGLERALLRALSPADGSDGAQSMRAALAPSVATSTISQAVASSASAQEMSAGPAQDMTDAALGARAMAAPQDAASVVPANAGDAALPVFATATAAPDLAYLPASPAEPPAPPNAIMAFILGGNTLARIGVLLLFIGVGFMVKYAAEHAHFPIEWRLASIVVVAIVMLGIGWRLRTQRPGYAMVVQGGAIGILYLTVFAALQLYHLLPPAFAFVLLVWIALTAAFLAIRQDAMALAIVGAVGGFLAPLLASTGDGNHVLLFGYYLVLNVGVFAVAWFKAWRPLNLVGFVFTFAIGTLWGSRFYRPDLFATTEPFLVAFFLFYLAIPIAYAWRRSVTLKHYVDGTIVFGTPLAVAALQATLVRNMPFGMAFSALVLAALYIGAAMLMWKRRGDALRQLVEAFLALGILFATLAIPLAFDARVTTAVWAVEGAGLVWVGMHQRRMRTRVAGLSLQLLAGWIFVTGMQLWPVAATVSWTLPVLNSAFIGALLLALAGVATAWWYHHEGEALEDTRHVVGHLAFAWGWLWWLVGCGHEIERLITGNDAWALLFSVVALTALAAFMAAQRWQWRAAWLPARALLPLLLLHALLQLADGHAALLSGGSLAAWPVALAVAVFILWRTDTTPDVVPGPRENALQHVLLLWLVTLLVTDRVVWFVDDRVQWSQAWRAAALLTLPALALAGIARLSRGTRWPVAAHPTAYLAVGGTVLAAALAVVGFGINVANNGDASPLAFLPLLNPVDLALLLALVASGAWLLRVHALWPAARGPMGFAATILGALGFLWLNGALLRTLHQWTGVAYTPWALWNSMLVQASLSILWAVTALALMVYAHRRAARLPWMIGGVLLAAVIAKLFLVDLSNIGGLPRIVSFLGVGVLVLLIGYVAPVPPRRAELAP